VAPVSRGKYNPVLAIDKHLFCTLSAIQDRLHVDSDQAYEAAREKSRIHAMLSTQDPRPTGGKNESGGDSIQRPYHSDEMVLG